MDSSVSCNGENQTLNNKEVVMNSFHFYFVKNLLQKVMRGNAKGEKDLRL